MPAAGTAAASGASELTASERGTGVPPGGRGDRSSSSGPGNALGAGPRLLLDEAAAGPALECPLSSCSRDALVSTTTTAVSAATIPASMIFMPGRLPTAI